MKPKTLGESIGTFVAEIRAEHAAEIARLNLVIKQMQNEAQFRIADGRIHHGQSGFNFRGSAVDDANELASHLKGVS